MNPRDRDADERIEEMKSHRALSASIAAAMAVFTARPAEAELPRTYVIVESGGPRREVDERTFYREMPGCSRVEVRREPRGESVTYVCYR